METITGSPALTKLIDAPWKTPNVVIHQDLTDEEYILNGLSVDKYDIILNRNTWLYLKNIEEGREYKLILNVVDYSSDASLMPDSLPLFLFISSLDGEQIVWHGLDADHPTIYTNGKILLYKSHGVIYGELIKSFIADGGSASA